MTIDVACTCGARFRIKDELAGRKAKCKKCGAVVVIPAPSAPALLEELPSDDPLGLGVQPAAPSGADGFSDLFSEEIPVAGAPLAGGAASGPAPIQISFEFDVKIPNDQEVADLIQENLHRHFARAKAGTYSQIEIEVHVLDWSDHGTDKMVALSFFGSVNGKRISKNFERDLRRTTGGAVRAASKLWDSAAEAVRGARLSQQMTQILENIVDEACMHIDKAAGLSKKASSKLWDTLEIVKFIAAAGVLLVTLIVLLAKSKNVASDFTPCLFLALLAGAVVFVPLHVFQLLSVPAGFYKQDPRGRRVLSRWKAKNVAELKIRLVVMSVIVFAAIGFFWWVLSDAGDQRPGGRPATSRPSSSSNRPAPGRANSDARASSRPTRALAQVL